MCNREMKFGLFVDYARKAGFDGIATGHYVQTIATGAAALHEGVDANKDQSYFLALLNQQQIQQLTSPLEAIPNLKFGRLRANINYPMPKKALRSVFG